ncbi:hypothetical protein CDL15_Pgr001314 [Punica granatum]|uniref:RCC1-like domain-containing protein n=1 Tax=Punica granatum TaxID=22663 RepID=A0A218WLG6_PUNGR|nr:hypothetical protein CDL15_Pgr001314 [Punica granatum]
MQNNGRKILPVGAQKDLWLIVREGSLADVDSALALLKKSGGNINARNSFGLTPLHIATWRNHIPIVRRLLGAGADPDARDGESGWSSLHRALHFGHLAVASILLQSGASIMLEDSKSRTPVDLLSGPISQVVGSGRDSVATEVFSWGSGANYQLGTGNACIQKLPCKVESLHVSLIKLVSAAKFHSVAVSARGEVFTWGFGRGGRLGHPDFDIHSGQAAVITPRQVTSGLGCRCVKAIAAAKHHTVIATEAGEVFTWGSNREGQLGYTSIDTQPTPRRVSSLKSKIVAVAAANKHTAAVSECGEVFTWGCNREGQLGYGTSNSGSNYIPRLVEYLKGKRFEKVAAAKYHTVVLGADGEVFTWGHRLVTPKRVVIARNLRKSGPMPLKFHSSEKLHVSAIAAGMTHSMALSDDGTLFYWVSSDPDLRCQQLYSLCQRNIVSISAGKYWSAAVTATGDVYMWDGKKGTDKPPVLTRLHGAKRATSISVGETHLLIIGSLYQPPYPTNVAKHLPQDDKLRMGDDEDQLDEGFLFDDVESAENLPSVVHNEDTTERTIPSLKSLCEKVAAEHLVEPRNAIQLLEIADSLEADDLRKHCEDIVIRNLDYIFAVSSQSIAGTSPEILANLEKLLDSRSSEPWSFRRLPTPTATFPAVVDSEEEDYEVELIRTRSSELKKSFSKNGNQYFDSFLQPKHDLDEGISKQVRALRKKLQQIEMLEEKQSKGHHLDQQQIAKLKTRAVLECSLFELGVPVEIVNPKPLSLGSSDGKGIKKAEVSKKQRKKSKKQALQTENMSGVSLLDDEARLTEGFQLEESEVIQEDSPTLEEKVVNEVMKEPPVIQKKEVQELPKNKTTPTSSKKKSKKGGLSMFLSGALDDVPKEPPPPPTPKSEGPAWGGAKVPKGSASLREIQDEQKKFEGVQIPSSKTRAVDAMDNNKTEGKISLSSFISSNPIPVVQPCSSHAADAEKGTPPWAASGTPPHPSRPSLRDIQMQQGKKQQSLSHSPKTRTTGFAVSSGQGSPSDSSGVNRWFKPETEAPSSIRSIQIEEKAMKDLKRFYGSVKIVSKNQF